MIDHGDIRHEPEWPVRGPGAHVLSETVPRALLQPTPLQPTPLQPTPLRAGVVPTVITALESTLRTAFHAFDAVERMELGHRARVVDELGGLVPDAASAAARAGFGPWATMVVLTAAEKPPAWAEVCARWDGLIDASLHAIAAADASAWPDDLDATEASDVA